MATPLCIRGIRLAATLSLPLWAGVTLAQSPPATGQPTDPSAASSPHQRNAVKTPGAEAPASGAASSNDASTPHQKQVLKKKKKHTAKPATDTTTSTPP